MDPALKDVLKANRTLLIKNMIPCEDFYAQLIQNNVFPGSMMYEIKVRCPNCLNIIKHL